MAVLSIQSAVVYGHVGNAVAVPALQALGHETWRVDTVAFSNHPGHGQFAGDVRPADEIASLLRGMETLGVLWACDAVLSGYLGEPETATVVAAAVNATRRANPNMNYVLDPVIGDDGRVFVRDGVLEGIRDQLVPLADIVLPNRSELGWLVGMEIRDLASMFEAARQLLRHGPGIVVVTGVEEAEEMATYAVTADAIWRSAAARRDRRFNGTGDLFAALFTGWFLRSRDPALALATTVAGLDLVTGETERLGTAELAIIPVLAKLTRTGEIKPANRVA
jgi:pyridoxine kinase